MLWPVLVTFDLFRVMSGRGLKMRVELVGGEGEERDKGDECEGVRGSGGDAGVRGG